ncbi:MAG: hypothetical protein ACXWKB_09480 [Methyloceanibacter sp.]
MTMRKAVMAMAMLMAAGGNGLAEDQPAPTPPETQWTLFQSPERGFAIEFPGTPQVTTTPIEGQNPLIQYDFQVGVGSDEAYQVVVLEYPEGKAPNPPDNEYYLKVASAYAKGSQARLRKKGAATIAEHAGYEAIVDDGKGKLNHLLDIVPVGDRVYLLISAGPKNHATGDDAEHFRDSFRVLGGEPQSASNPSASGETTSSSP